MWSASDKWMVFFLQKSFWMALVFYRPRDNTDPPTGEIALILIPGTVAALYGCLYLVNKLPYNYDWIRSVPLDIIEVGIYCFACIMIAKSSLKDIESMKKRKIVQKMSEIASLLYILSNQTYMKEELHFVESIVNEVVSKWIDNDDSKTLRASRRSLKDKNE
eukprot:TRINITY_DN4917_c0_g1_i1.p1 TRINITY_DN4917_c0_g1~~TRINITY_DN4917_c0_g1_i1.p1  ORF type:complete len:162 (-),score=15.13 TRINITY_DN4917_c0_g1_i1:62-547(-)